VQQPITAATFTVAILLAASTFASAQQFVPTGRDTLRRLPGIEVVVEPLQPELERAGLTSEVVSAEVSSRLRAAGIVLYPSQRDNPSPSKPYLYIHLNAINLPRGGGYAVAIQVHVRQTLQSLTTESRVVNAMSWDSHNIVVAGPTTLREGTSQELRALVDTFIVDWRAVH
jgi:hypothetical protein